MKNLLFLIAIIMCLSVRAQQYDSAQFYYQTGLVEKAAKRQLVAYNQFSKAVSFNPKFVDAYIECGIAALEMRKTDLAIANFSRASELQPENMVAIHELSNLYFSYHQYAKAIEFAQKCKDCENSQKIIGISYYQQENYPEAVRFLIAAIKKNSEDAEANYILARAYLDMEQYKLAVPYYEKAVKMDATKNTWMYELGLLYYNNNDYKNAVASFTNAARNGYVESNDFNENLGYASLYNDDYEKGESLLMKVWERKPGNKDILRDMAEIFYLKKQYDKSLQYCQKLMEIDTKDGKALYQAGLNFIKKGQKDRGQQMCDKAIQLDPSLDALRKKKEMVGM